MCGIFAFLNHLVPRKREEIIKILLGGLKRLEYRGYDSAGLSVTGDAGEPVLFKEVGLVARLESFITATSTLDNGRVFEQHEGLAHTRWATHGPPSPVNSHPHRSDAKNQFVVVHNGIINNYKELKTLLEANGHVFESDTDTEVIAKLYLHEYNGLVEGGGSAPSFAELTTIVMSILTGAYAIIVTSTHYEHEMIGAKVGSPMIVGVRFASDVYKEVSHSASLSRVASVKMGGGSLGASGAIDLGGSASGLNASLGGGGPADANLRRVLSNLGEGRSLGRSGSGLLGEGSPLNRSQNIPLNSSISDALRAGEAAAPRVVCADVAMPPPPSAAQDLDAVEYYVSSDASAIIEYTNQVVYMEDYQICHFVEGDCIIYNCPRDARGVVIPESMVEATRNVQKLNIALEAIQKGSFKYFMLKEIYEQVDSIPNTLRGRLLPDAIQLGGLRDYLPDLRRARRLVFIACGTSYHSGVAARPIFEELCGIPVACENGSDFLDREAPIFRDDVCVFISQSGETADVLRTLKFCKARGALCVGVTNVVGSSIARETHCGVNVNAGPEIGVASTKAYTSQVLVLTMIALAMASDSKAKSERCAAIIADLHRLPALVKRVLELDGRIQAIAESVKTQKSMLVLGRGYGYATAIEAALKIKELTYLHCEGILAGELKHGTLALVDENMAIIAVATHDRLYSEIRSSLAQVCARGGKPIVICSEGDAMESQYAVTLPVPSVVDCLQGVLSVIPMQLLAYHIADKLGLDVDRPRNLSKSVTVS